MGYEGHLMREPGDTKAELVERSMAVLLEAHGAVGGDVVSGGGTGTWDVNTWVTELQAGSYCLMDTEYDAARARLRERPVRARHRHLADRPRAGLCSTPASRRFGMDHGDPTVLDAGDCWFVSDEHITFGIGEGAAVRGRRQGPGAAGPRRPHRVASTSASTSSTATRSSTSGTSTSAAGDPADLCVLVTHSSGRDLVEQGAGR